jgi:hypothetical protein
LSDAARFEIAGAIGKLRRLRYLQLDMFSDGRDCTAVGAGLVASGGCPELFELRLDRLEKNLFCVAREPSLILPSVRNVRIDAFCSLEKADEEALWVGSSRLQAPSGHVSDAPWGQTSRCACSRVRASYPESLWHQP